MFPLNGTLEGSIPPAFSLRHISTPAINFGALLQKIEHDSESKVVSRQLAQFFEATTDAIFFLDRDYCFTFLNRKAIETLSQGQDLIGRNLFQQFPDAALPGSPFLENYRRTMEHRVPAEFDAFYAATYNIWVRVQSYPVEDGIMVFFRDVTQEKLDREAFHRKTEEAERQHAELETIYRTAPIGLALFDLDDYHYLRLNDLQAAFFGLNPEQVVGKTLLEMAPIEGLRELFDQVAGGEPVINYPLEGALVTDPTEYRYWTVSYFPVYGHDGTIQAITAASLEITNQKKAEQALIQSEKLAAVGRLASSIAHEINNPLEAVTNLLYLARTSDDLVEVHALLDAAEIELRRVSAIASQTLRFHKQASSPQAVTPEQLIDSVLSIYQGRIANSRASVSRRMRAHREFRCFEGEIRQVLSNLVSNALDAMPEGGHLVLRSRNGTDWKSGKAGIVITIADTGHGMSPETRDKLFHAFFTTKGLTGTGLGLWVTREIIDRHQGLLNVRSSEDPVHHGTVFTVFLPFEAVVR
jgi:PAS domain S-box-containing protein